MAIFGLNRAARREFRQVEAIMKAQMITHMQARKFVRETVRKEHPETVECLVRLVQQEYKLPEEVIMNIVCQAGLRLSQPQTRATGLKNYIASARWYWFIMAFSMLTAAVILVLPETSPVIYLRYILSTVFILWIPGYCLIRSLFPRKELEGVDLIAQSLATSIVLVPMTAFVLHYTPWGINAVSLTVVILILTLALSTLGVFRDERAHKDSQRTAHA